MRSRLVIGNWKLNGSLQTNADLLAAVKSRVAGQNGKSCGLCVPAPYLAQAQAILAGSAVGWGAQDVSQYESGAYTGEVSAAMVKDFAAQYAIVGHSERRTLFGETDEVVAKKFAQASKAGLKPLLCIGETLAERETGQTEVVVKRQLDSVIAHVGVAGMKNAILAYEPVWAIGTGRTASPQQAQDVHAFLRSELRRMGMEAMPILYGGSVKADNAAALFAMPDVDGGLIGGASLKAGEFLAIWAAL